jgi:hypothetical protein
VTADQRVILPREYLAAARQRDINHLPPVCRHAAKDALSSGPCKNPEGGVRRTFPQVSGDSHPRDFRRDFEAGVADRHKKLTAIHRRRSEACRVIRWRDCLRVVTVDRARRCRGHCAWAPSVRQRGAVNWPEAAFRLSWTVPCQYARSSAGTQRRVARRHTW